MNEQNNILNCVCFDNYLNLCRLAENKVGFLVDTFFRLHINAPAEDFENLGGRMARLWVLANRDTGYLLKIIWTTSADSIAGSHLNYIQGIIRKTNKTPAKYLVGVDQSRLDKLRQVSENSRKGNK